MLDILDLGERVIDAFTLLGNSWLFAPSWLPGFESTPVIVVVMGGGLITLLVYKGIKFFTDIVF